MGSQKKNVRNVFVKIDFYPKFSILKCIFAFIDFVKIFYENCAVDVFIKNIEMFENFM